MQEVVEAVMPMIEPQALSKGLKLTHGPCPAHLRANADRGKAEQIVLNLLSNAVKFTPEGGRIMVGCGGDEMHVRVTVADTGPGIPADQQEAIFQPFVQLGRTLVSGHEGTGLGLAISRDLARAMNGDLSVKGRRGGGATFTLSLPRA
jgi:signal transduction histidine kinase